MEEVKKTRGRPSKYNSVVVEDHIFYENVNNIQKKNKFFTEEPPKPRGRPRTRPIKDTTKKEKKDPERRCVINEDLYRKKLNDIKQIRLKLEERRKYTQLVIRKEPITISISI